MRRLALMVALAATVCLGGCFKMNVNLGGDEEGGSGGPVDSSGGSAPRQIPAGATGNGSFRDIVAGIVGGVTVGAEHGAVFYAYDTLAYPAKPIELAAKAQSAGDLKAIVGVTVGIYHGETLLGQAVTQADGIARLQWTPPQAGNYEFTARIIAVGATGLNELLQVSPAPLLVAARDKNTPLIVIDLDHTVVDSSFFRVLTDGGRPMGDSVAVTQRLAQNYSLIYLTHRPDLMTRTSKQWLVRGGYPPGPLLVSRLKDAFDSGAFKTAKLSELRVAFPGVAVGIGDKLSDAQAYVDNGLAAYLIPHYDHDDTDDLREMAKEIRRLRGRGRLQVVSSWRQIESGIYQRRTWPPAAFADALDRRAREIEARERRDDDDDDDG
jgi:hypothetical protein